MKQLVSMILACGLGACAAMPPGPAEYTAPAPAPAPSAEPARAASREPTSLHADLERYLAQPGRARRITAAVDSEGDASELAKAAQNPIANLISLPFETNIGINAGADDEVSNILNIKPVYPIDLNEDWLLINRAIIPVIYQPNAAAGGSDEFGLGDSLLQFFFSPKGSGKVTWGIGPNINLPTATDSRLGGSEWGLGINAVVLAMPGKWVVGGLIQNTWGVNDPDDLNVFTIQPFVNYNLRDGWFVGTGPAISANWNADSDNRWTIPLGGGIGKITKFGKQPVQLKLFAYANVEAPRGAPDAIIQFQITFLFPRKK